ncbi:MAG: hypothetical protein K9K62_02595 [Desulfobacteraceae bacterium]|nr:hypothetical protein [Desulfobacteraceae bacterium]
MQRFRLFTALLLVVALWVSSTAAAARNPVENGPYRICTYTQGLSSAGYKGAKMFYPCRTRAGPFAATTVTSGYGVTYRQMNWISTHLASHGYIVLAITPNNHFRTTRFWRKAHNAGIKQLIAENRRVSSPVHGLIKTNRLQVMGHSQGGGGCLLAAADQENNIASAIALAPHMDFDYDLSTISCPTQIQTGTNDTTVYPGDVVEIFQSLPDNISRAIAYLDNVDHADWALLGDYQNRLKTYITAWMKVHLDGDLSYQPYIDGHQDWFNLFKYYKAGETGGPGTGGNQGGAGCGW